MPVASRSDRWRSDAMLAQGCRCSASASALPPLLGLASRSATVALAHLHEHNDFWSVSLLRQRRITFKTIFDGFPLGLKVRTCGELIGALALERTVAEDC